MSIGKRVVVGGALLLTLSLFAPDAWAQFASTLEGIVTDPSGGVVPAATVTITNEATGVTQTGSTTTAGLYRFPALPGGYYTLKVSLQGFKTWSREHVRLESTQIRAVNVQLEMGAADSEEVTVTADAPLVETTQARVSGLIQENQVQDLPAHRAELLQPGRAHAGRDRARHRRRPVLRPGERRHLQQRVRREHERQWGPQRVEQLHGRLRHRQLQPAQRGREHQPQRGERRGGSRPREQLQRGVRPQRAPCS